jgi:hypothetical protein
MLQLRFDYLFIGIYKELPKPPYQHYIAIFWNQKFNLYKEQALDIGEMKHERETDIGMTSLSTKQRRINPVEKLPTMVELGKVTFLGRTHNSIWALDIHEEAWAKRWVLHC